MKEKFRLFMLGRYGIDAFSKFLMRIALILCVLNIFLNNVFISFLLFATIVYVYYRMLSKNLNKRAWENMKYVQIKSKVVGKFDSIKSVMKQRKTHHIYKCPT